MDKICTKCGVSKTYKDFDSHGSGRVKLNPVCKSCRSAYNKYRYHLLGKKRPYNSYSYYKQKYGLTKEEVDGLPTDCGICGDTDNLVVDHCHETGRIRGRLCSSCNLGIGHFKDSVELLSSAIVYLELSALESQTVC